MKKRVRLIDLDSIKPNPTAGNTMYHYPGSIYTTIEEDGTITQRRTLHTVYSLSPEPSHNYRFLPMPVTCSACGATFDVSELTNDVTDDGYGGEYFNDQVCPKCNAWSCLDFTVVPETLKDALKRKEGSDE